MSQDSRKTQKSNAEDIVYGALHYRFEFGENEFGDEEGQGVQSVTWDGLNGVAVIRIDGVEFNVRVSRRRGQ